MKEICPVCGCRELEYLNKASHIYRCKACGEKFDLTEKPPVEKIIEKVIVEKPAEKDGLTPAEIYKKNIDGIVEITSYFSETDIRGTAFYVSGKGYLLTNLHMVVTQSNSGNADLCKECYGNGKNADDDFELEVVYLDKDNDLALLKAKMVQCKPLKLATKMPTIGESVVAIGNVKGTGLSIVNGIVSDLDREFKGHSAFLFNALVAEGCSGGPIFNEKGEVCGVTVGGRVDAAGMKYAIPIDVVIKFIKLAEIEKEIKIELL